MNKINLINTFFSKAKQNIFTENDFLLLTNEFLAKEIETTAIKKYSQMDSKNIIHTLIKSTAIKIYNIVSHNNKYIFTEPVVAELFNCLFLDYNFESSDCYLEYSVLKQEMVRNVLNILKRIRMNETSNQTVDIHNINDNGTGLLHCINDKISYYLQNKEECEIVGINLSLIATKVQNIKNKKLKILNDKKMDDKFLLCICSIKNEIVSENLKDIFRICKSMLMSHKGTISIEKDRRYLFCMAIISEINTLVKEKDVDLIDIIPEEISEPYLGYVYSLMVDDESVIKTWEVLLVNGFVNDIFENLKEVYTQLHISNTCNTDFYNNLKYGIKILASVAAHFKESHTFFIRNFDVVLNLLWTELPYKILGDLFNFVSHLLYDEEVKNRVYDYFVLTKAFYSKNSGKYINKGYSNECSNTYYHTYNENDHILSNKKNIYEVFEDELKNESFEFTEGLINFFVKLKPENLFEDERNEFFNCAIKSCNLKILSVVLENIEIKKLCEKENIIKAIKRGIEKDEKICELFISFIIRNVTSGSCVNSFVGDKEEYNKSMDGGIYDGNRYGSMYDGNRYGSVNSTIPYTNHSVRSSSINDLLYVIAQDVVLLNLIVKSKCELFFIFASFFDSNCFVLFLNDDFLERVGENVKLGLEYLASVCSTNDEYCKFVIDNKRYFNNISDNIAGNGKYNGIGDTTYIDDTKQTNFYLLKMYNAVSKHFVEEFDIENEEEKLVVKKSECMYFYEILTRIIVHRYEKGENIRKYVVKEYMYSNENIASYCDYLKTLLAIEENVDDEIKYLLSLEIENESIGELIGYYKSVKDECKFEYKFECKKLENIILNMIECKRDNNIGYDRCRNIGMNTTEYDRNKNIGMSSKCTQSDSHDLFVKHFRKASKYEKFLLFLILDTERLSNDEVYNKKVFGCVIEEIKEMVKNDVSDKQDVLILKQCLNTLLYMKNLDDVVKLLKNVKLPHYFNDLLVKICIKNILNYGKEVFDVSVLERGSIELQVKCCFFSYGYKIMKDKVIKSWVEDLRRKIVSEDLEMIRKDMLRHD
ncbi:hypothetical protein BDAP_002673 [Binucleata daphniae]